MIDMIASIHGDVIRLGAYVRCGAAKMKFVTQESKKEGALPRPATIQLGGILQLCRVSRMSGLRLRQVVTVITGYYSTRLFIFGHRRPVRIHTTAARHSRGGELPKSEVERASLRRASRF